MKNRNILRFVAILVVGIAYSGQIARASLVDLGYGAPPSSYGIDPASEALYLQSLGYTGLTYLDKYNQNGTWDKTFHDTTVITATLSGNTGLVGWDLAGTGYLMGLVTLKDGQSGDNKGRYHIYGITVDQQLASGILQAVNYLDPSGGPKDISHVSFWGVPNPVPEPSTYIAGMLLLIPVLAQGRRMLRKG